MYIGANFRKIALSTLVNVPPFLRFGNVKLDYSIGFQSIVQKCDSFRGYLLLIKASLYDPSCIRFYVDINQEFPRYFRNHVDFLEHIRDVVSICDSSRGYSFVFRRYRDSDDFGNVIASLLEIPEISRSSFVYFAPDREYQIMLTLTLTQLPIEAISNWLNRVRHPLDQKKRARRLELLCPDHFQDAQIRDLCDLLKRVSYIFEYLQHL